MRFEIGEKVRFNGRIETVLALGYHIKTRELLVMLRPNNLTWTYARGIDKINDNVAILEPSMIFATIGFLSDFNKKQGDSL